MINAANCALACREGRGRPSDEAEEMRRQEYPNAAGMPRIRRRGATALWRSAARGNGAWSPTTSPSFLLNGRGGRATCTSCTLVESGRSLPGMLVETVTVVSPASAPAGILTAASPSTTLPPSAAEIFFDADCVPLGPASEALPPVPLWVPPLSLLPLLPPLALLPPLPLSLLSSLPPFPPLSLSVAFSCRSLPQARTAASSEKVKATDERPAGVARRSPSRAAPSARNFAFASAECR